jgi:NAD+ synthase
VNIGAMHAALRAETDQWGSPAGEGEFSVPASRTSDINVGPRLRMTTLRYIAQFLGARLVGTGNLSESTVGYCTKDGDTSCDFALLLGLTSVEVVKVGLTLPELPRHLVEKTPTDGLSGMSDEEKMGLSYQDIHAYIRNGSCGNAETDAAIRKRENANRHKRQMPVILNPFSAGDNA